MITFRLTSSHSETRQMNSEVAERKNEETPAYSVYSRRFYVLFLFSFLGFNQCLMWLTFSPIARNAEKYYNTTVDTIDLLLNWGPIISIPCLPLGSLLMNTPNGLRYCVIILAIIDFFAALIRILPSIIFHSTSSNFGVVALPFIHTGQILNAVCGPLAAIPVSQLSSLWFAPHERTRATTIAILANNNIGTGVGFIISPYLVTEPEHVPYLLYIHFGLACVASILTLLSFPAQPASAPSAAAELLMAKSTSHETSHHWRQFLRDIWKCLTNPSFLFLSAAGGLVNGAFNAWTGLYDVLLESEHYTETQAGRRENSEYVDHICAYNYVRLVWF